MANELEGALKNVATQIAGYVKNAATLTVVTNYVQVGAEGEPHLVGKTVIALDGDSQTTVPLRQGSTGALEVDTALFEIHQRSVAAAVDYRARMLAALLEALRSIRA